METELYKKLKKDFGVNFIGPQEIDNVHNKIGLNSPLSLNKIIPNIPFSIEDLKVLADTHILILQVPFFKNGNPCNILEFRNKFGINPENNEPCFYNQDWYINENFVKKELSFEWKLILKNPINESRGVDPSVFLTNNRNLKLPSSISCVYLFFVNYFHTGGEILWKDDYTWTSDFDDSGDRIYVGRYIDSSGKAKNGFSIHRHLSIKQNYGIVSII